MGFFLESFRDFWRSLEICRDFWRVLETFGRLQVSFIEFFLVSLENFEEKITKTSSIHSFPLFRVVTFMVKFCFWCDVYGCDVYG